MTYKKIVKGLYFLFKLRGRYNSHQDFILVITADGDFDALPRWHNRLARRTYSQYRLLVMRRLWVRASPGALLNGHWSRLTEKAGCILWIAITQPSVQVNMRCGSAFRNYTSFGRGIASSSFYCSSFCCLPFQMQNLTFKWAPRRTSSHPVDSLNVLPCPHVMPVSQLWTPCLIGLRSILCPCQFYAFCERKDLTLTPTWFEHATFWSGVRRATVAPRSLAQTWLHLSMLNVGKMYYPILKW